jgi:predicted transcriptional regulator
MGIGLAADQAATLAVTSGRDLAARAVPIGLGCRACTRPDCPQRSAPPAGRAMLPSSERESGVTPFGFALD